MITRREVLRSSLAAVALAGVRCPTPALAQVPEEAQDRPYLSAALQAAQWLRTARQVTKHGITWPVDPLKPDQSDSSFYTGTPGIPPFFLELYHATGDEIFLKEALTAVDEIIATLLTDQRLSDPNAGAGFYAGLGGIAYTIEMAHQVSAQEKYRAAAQRAVNAILSRTAQGAQWSDGLDIVSAAAGGGLFLLWWAAQTNDSQAVLAAHQVGIFLLAQAHGAKGDLAWNATSSIGRYYPNFSHGTAGVGYFLATLSKVTGEKRFLQAAIDGAQHLQAIATCTRNGCLIFHYTPGGEHRFYLGWCHGPAGTSRLFYKLSELTGDPSWRNWADSAVNALMATGIPEVRTPGFWNNVSMCCCDTAVMQFMLDLHGAYGEARYLNFAHRVVDDILKRATVDERGMRWVQAENRIDPATVIAQTGYMQGAAGMGTGLLHLDGRKQHRQPLIVLPDSPYARS
jgi:lantibiotic modifying enzyme